MKKIYNSPVAELLIFKNVDIITTSGENSLDNTGEDIFTSLKPGF